MTKSTLSNFDSVDDFDNLNAKPRPEGVTSDK